MSNESSLPTLEFKLVRSWQMLSNVRRYFGHGGTLPVDPSTRCLHKHEKYNSCGTACPLNCEDVLSSNLQKPCTLQCVAGCYCEKGYVRKTDDKNSPCVKMEDCYSDA
ncbi:unnamed protein product [Adineta ricciae]|uniref:TIL domain-containing protein n=1 Tax=Adineta ricciae TaxID=249248 RepID=A0A815MHN9_ADIRI|nr:unnamed protein product [Adineta ricciae]